MTGEEIAVATHEHVIEATKPRPALGLFERYLTRLGGAVHRGRHRARPLVPGAVPGDRPRRDRPGQSAGRSADLADDHSDAVQDRCRRAASGEGALARHRGDAVHQLGGQAVLDGAAGLAVHRLPVPAMAAGKPDRQLHRRADHSRRRPVHGDGVRVVEPVRWRAALHAVPGRAQRHHHGGRLRAHRGAACSASPRSSCRGRRW